MGKLRHINDHNFKTVHRIFMNFGGKVHKPIWDITNTEQHVYFYLVCYAVSVPIIKKKRYT